MAKKLPNLRLVTRTDNPAEGELHSQSEEDFLHPEEVFDIVSLNQLSSAERGHVERIVSFTCPTAGLLGVARTPRHWDIRPVLKFPLENSPSLLRLLGPEVTLSTGISSRMNDLFGRIESYQDIKSSIRDRGLIEGQIWYRRELVDHTLEDLLRVSKPLGVKRVQAIAKNLVQTVENWHARGIAHGHIAAANVALKGDSDVRLIDTGVGVSIVQASKALGLTNFAKGYFPISFAPETLESESVLFTADYYGLGRVINHLFSKVQITEKNKAYVHRCVELSQLLLQRDPAERPTISKIKPIIYSFDEPVPTKPKPKKPLKTETQKITPKSSANLIGRYENPVPRMTTRLSKSLIDDVRAEAKKIDEENELTVVKPEELHVSEEAIQESPAEEKYEELPNEELLSVEEEHVFGSPDEIMAHAKEVCADAHKGSNFLFWIFALAMVCGAGLFYYKNHFAAPLQHNYSNEELQLLWRSTQPARMAVVAESAIQSENPSTFAENLILTSALRGEDVGTEINSPLIKVAFDKRWFEQLSFEDRRAVIAISTSDLLKGRMPADLKPFSELHPGVIFAISATGGKAVSRSISDIPISSFVSLPPPLGPAFSTLAKDETVNSVGDAPARTLAKLAARGHAPGLESTEELYSFLEVNTLDRLKSLAVIFLNNDVEAGNVLETLLNHPNRILEHPIIDWGKKRELLTRWSEMPEHEKLMLLAGIKPYSGLNDRQLAELFSHPEPAIRKFAIERLIESVSFKHPSSLVVLKLLAAEPSILSPEQTVILGKILLESDTVEKAMLDDWISKKPDQSLVEVMLLGTVKNKKAWRFDFLLSRYLRTSSWSPDKGTLAVLIYHPDPVTRLLAYSKVEKLKDRKAAMALFKKALQSEREEEYRTLLNSYISLLSAS